jgi:hypothetical protein
MAMVGAAVIVTAVTAETQISILYFNLVGSKSAEHIEAWKLFVVFRVSFVPVPPVAVTVICRQLLLRNQIAAIV